MEYLDKLNARIIIYILWVPADIGLEGKEATDELTKKGAGTLPYGIRREFIAMKLSNDGERLKELYWGNLPGME